MRDHGHHYVANAKPDRQCLLVVPKSSQLKTLAEARGKRFVVAEQVSYMARLCRAELLDRGIDLAKENVQIVREQAAVPFYLTGNNFGDVGAIALYSGPTKKLDKKNLRVLHTSVAQPYFPLVAHAHFKPKQIRAMQKELEALDSKPIGAEIIKRIGITGFDTGSETRMKELLVWLKKLGPTCPANLDRARPGRKRAAAGTGTRHSLRTRRVRVGRRPRTDYARGARFQMRFMLGAVACPFP